jgi:hypothetical protein
VLGLLASRSRCRGRRNVAFLVASSLAGCGGVVAAGGAGDAGSDVNGSLPPGIGDDDSGGPHVDSTAPPPWDGGPDVHPVPTDTGAPDVQPGATVAKVYFVNAAVDPTAGPIRFCVGLAVSPGTVTVAGGIFPFPNAGDVLSPIPGLQPGYGMPLDQDPQLSAFDLSTLSIAFFALDARNPLVAHDTPAGGPDGGAERPCENLIGTDGLGAGGQGGGVLVPGKDYWPVGALPKGTFAHGSAEVLAVTGCFPGLAGSQAAFCPAGYDPLKGNLTLTMWKLDTSTVVASGALGMQFAHASPAYDQALAAAGVQVATSFGFFAPPTKLVSGVKFGDLAPPVLVQTAPPSGSLAGAHAEGTNPVDSGAVNAVDDSFDQIATTTYPDGVPPGGQIVPGKGYVYVFVGDPTQPPEWDGGEPTNPRYPHFLAFPTADP